MQYTHECNGVGLPDYPTNVKPKDVHVWRHDSGMILVNFLLPKNNSDLININRSGNKRPREIGEIEC